MPKIAVIGGGASGFAAAITARRRQKDAQITIYEKLERPLKKILATGNGRCNLTNRTATVQDYFGDVAFAASALSEFPPESTVDFFSSMGLLCREEELGRVYPLSGQASAVRDILLSEAERLGIRIKSGCEITSIKRNGRGFLLNAQDYADAVVLSFGGKAAPKQGTDGSAYRLFGQLGIPMCIPRPALTALLCKAFPKTLKGVRQTCDIMLSKGQETLYRITGEVQFTEYGLSGVPIMQLSRLCAGAEQTPYVLTLDCLPQYTAQEIFSFLFHTRQTHLQMDCGVLFAALVPKALSDYLLLQAHISKSTPLQNLQSTQLEKLVKITKHLRFTVDKPRGFDFAQVTAGGADCRAFYKETLECKSIPRLYACGEALNVDGGCGGYNLQWAWCSGRAVGEALAKENWH